MGKHAEPQSAELNRLHTTEPLSKGTTMYVYQASIGRNTRHGEPLSRRDWLAFIADVEHVMDVLGTVEVHVGTGTWNGVREDSAHLTVLRSVPASDASALPWTRGLLADLAARWGQDAIALTVGTSELIH